MSPKLKFNVEQTEYGESGDWTQPQPGLYSATIREINAGFSKGDDGQPDRSRPRLEVIYHELKPTDKPKDKTRYAQLWEYLSYSEASEWRMAQFLEAIGVATEKKRKGQWDPDKYQGTEVKIRVNADTDLNGNYRGKVGGVFALDDEEAEEEEEEYEDEEESEDEGEEEEEEEEPEEEEEEPEEEEEEEEEEVPYEEWTPAELREEADARNLKSTGSKKALIKRLEEDDEEEGDEEEEAF